MQITSLLTDAAVLTELGQRLASRRLALQLTQAEAARRAGVAKRTLERVEAGMSAELTTFIRIMRALDSLPELNRLLPDAGPSPMELLKHKGKKRQRAPGKTPEEQAAEEWTWDEQL